jgi:hypothetical protein
LSSCVTRTAGFVSRMTCRRSTCVATVGRARARGELRRYRRVHVTSQSPPDVEGSPPSDRRDATLSGKKVPPAKVTFALGRSAEGAASANAGRRGRDGLGPRLYPLGLRDRALQARCPGAQKVRDVRPLAPDGEAPSVLSD